ncbi:hypothetical protein CHARACLAT_001659 [Characodon lateralis]|uniref:Uncharacterized protein n=1 Tax=Characodon lateralis TaxID=208331 RepID=A0ABU7EFJ9_9TELE|nr:hypothetical protein [Characodon lateralis]
MAGAVWRHGVRWFSAQKLLIFQKDHVPIKPRMKTSCGNLLHLNLHCYHIPLEQSDLQPSASCRQDACTGISCRRCHNEATFPQSFVHFSDSSSSVFTSEGFHFTEQELLDRPNFVHFLL